MEGTALFPASWHPQRPHMAPDGLTLLTLKPSRSAVGGVRYYFIHFGISSHDEDIVTGRLGQERAPELDGDTAYDPFKLDVYVLGMAYETFLLEVSSRISHSSRFPLTCRPTQRHPETEFVSPLVKFMTSEDPKDRPSAAEALNHFKSIRTSLTESTMAQRFRPRDPELPFMGLINDQLYRIQDLWWRLKARAAIRPPPT